MIKWFRRLFNIWGGKASAVLDKLEDPKVVLELLLKDMAKEIRMAKEALGNCRHQSQKARADQRSFERKAAEYRRGAEKYLEQKNEKRAKYMLRRARETEGTVEGFRKQADSLELQVEALKEQIRSNELKYEEAKSKRHSLLAQKVAADNLSKLSKTSSAYSETGSAFADYERLIEKLDDQIVESNSAIATSFSSGISMHEDMLLLESNVDADLEDLRKRVEKRDSGDSDKKSLDDLEAEFSSEE